MMVTSEAVPFAKVGGLADVVPALAAELARRGHDVRLVMPRYADATKNGAAPLPGALGVPMAAEEFWTEVFETQIEHAGYCVTVYLVEHLELFGRNAIYARPGDGGSSEDLLRFAVLSRAAFQICRKLSWSPDIMHAHDWPTALVPVYLRTVEKRPPFAETAGVFSIHNLGYQGVFELDQISRLPLNRGRLGREALEFYGRINSLKGGILCADLVTTVSPSYAEEIQQPEFGFGIDGVLRSRAAELHGILNGIDEELWDPSADPLLPATFTADDLSGKVACKAALQRRFGFPVAPDTPLIGIIARLVDQKGLPELLEPGYGCLNGILSELGVQMVVLGTGDPRHETRLLELAQAHHNLAYERAFDEPLAHLIEAGSDFFLMPSRYEPCGLNQMYSLRYGSIPIATRTGGLRDTILDFDDSGDEAGDQGTGFLFDSCTPTEIYHAVERAVRVYRDRPQQFAAMRTRGMRTEFGWARAARNYERLYLRALQLRMQH